MANTVVKLKRTSTAGRTPNTTNSGNSQYIAAGELALNMTDKILYSSNGSTLIEVGANNTTVNITNSVAIGTNTAITGDTYKVGNSSVNTMISSTQVNTDIFNADVAVYVGANVDITPSGVFIGNTTVNTAVNSSIIVVGNSTINSTSMKAEMGHINANVVTTLVLAAGFNCIVAGPYTVASGNTVTISDGARLVVV